MENRGKADAEESSGRRRIDKVPTRVEDVMTRRVVTLRPDQTFADTIKLMEKHSFRHFLVVESTARLVGVISDRDVLRAVARVKDWNKSYVQHFMSRDVVAVKPDTKLSVATGMMLSRRINCLPVVDDNGLVCGIVTSTDLLKVFRSIQESVEKDKG